LLQPPISKRSHSDASMYLPICLYMPVQPEIWNLFDRSFISWFYFRSIVFLHSLIAYTRIVVDDRKIVCITLIWNRSDISLCNHEWYEVNNSC
jgi:hypothetical protein